MTVRYFMKLIDFDPHPRPLSRRETGEKTQIFRYISLAFVREGYGGEVEPTVISNIKIL